MPVFNKRQFLEQSLTSVLTAARRDDAVEIVCLDHGSTDGSREILLGLPGVSVLGVSGGNIGFLRNEGARRTTAPILVFLDSDVVILPDYFLRVRQAFEHSAAAAVGCEYVLPHNPHWLERAWYQLTAREGDGRRHYINAGNFVIRREAFNAVGGFSESLETAEDTDICRRLRAAGFEIEQHRALRAAHLGNPRSLGGFFRKQVWHGVSSLDAAQHWHPDLVVTMAIGWALMMLGAVVAAGVAVSRGDWAFVGIAVGSLLLIPGATIAFRVARNRRVPPLLPSVVLATLFYAARFTALVKAIHRRRRPSPPQPPLVTVLR